MSFASKKLWLFIVLLLSIATPGVLKLWRAEKQRRAYGQLIAPVAEASWPWANARHEILARGVEHWLAVASDGTTLDLLSFDFQSNPRLRFELFDSDLATAPNATKLPNRFAYWENGPGRMARRINQNDDVIAAWNGSFWGLLNRQPRAADRSFHLSPVVLNGQIFYKGLNRRWSWGAKIVAGRPVFSLLHAPDDETLRQKFDFATGTLQALLKDGRALALRPYPWFGEKAPPGGLPSTPSEAGAISILDQMHTSRIGAGWNAQGRLFVLVVKEPDGEKPSRAAVNQRQRGHGGWTLHDHQRFWLAMKQDFGVQNAVGLDGGDVAQAFFRNPDHSFTMLVPRIATPETQNATLRLQTNAQFSAPQINNLKGGALNYFLVRQIQD